ncbi:hypothetical protein GCM10008918_04660 [Lactobacillus kefiranofaciens subsp. kefiranofaciens]
MKTNRKMPLYAMLREKKIVKARINSSKRMKLFWALVKVVFCLKRMIAERIKKRIILLKKITIGLVGIEFNLVSNW